MIVIDSKTVHQFKSRNDGKWKDCENEWDMKQYRKYHYETRIIKRKFKRNATIAEELNIELPSKAIFDLFKPLNK